MNDALRPLIVNYGLGNVGSVSNALEALGYPAVLSDKAEDFSRATHIILPGVGAFDDCMRALSRRGLVPLLSREVREKKKPYLGICLGMQILSERSEEGGREQGLGWISGTVRRFRVDERRVRVPHVGWNDVAVLKESPLFTGITKPIFYFVHSYHLAPRDTAAVAGTTDYGETFVSAVAEGNMFGVQFHPEKSQRAGLDLLASFLSVPSPLVGVQSNP